MSQKRGRGRPRDTRVEGMVVDAALAEIEEKGLRDCTMESIAARAGISKPTLYRRWPNRDALFYFLADQLSPEFEPIDTGDLRKDLFSVFDPQREQIYGGRIAVLIPIFVAEAARDPRVREFQSKLVEDRRASALLAFQRAKMRGELRQRVDLDALVDMMHGALATRALQRSLPITKRFVREIIDLAVRSVLIEDPST